MTSISWQPARRPQAHQTKRQALSALSSWAGLSCVRAPDAPSAHSPRLTGACIDRRQKTGDRRQAHDWLTMRTDPSAPHSGRQPPGTMNTVEPTWERAIAGSSLSTAP